MAVTFIPHYLFISRQWQSVAYVISYKLTPDGSKNCKVGVGVTLAPQQLRGNTESIGKCFSVDVHCSGGAHSILVLGFHDSQVGGPCHPPHGVLHVVAFPVGGSAMIALTRHLLVLNIFHYKAHYLPNHTFLQA